MAETAQPLETTGGTEILLREDRGAIAILTLNRPEARNPLSEAMLAELGASLDEISSDEAIKAVVLAANGPVFCAGHDLKEMTARRDDPDRGRAYFAEIMSACSAVMQAIVKLPKPVIAAVEGPATAAGCQLVASCDLAVADEGAEFCTPGVNLGLFCSTPMVALSRNVSRKHAMEMLLLGDMISAQRAREFGLVNAVAPRGQVLGEALQMAEQITRKSTATVKIGKEAFYRQIEMPLQAAYDYATEVMVTNMLHRDAEEGIGAFLEKRPPDWRDK